MYKYHLGYSCNPDAVVHHLHSREGDQQMYDSAPSPLVEECSYATVHPFMMGRLPRGIVVKDTKTIHPLAPPLHYVKWKKLSPHGIVPPLVEEQKVATWCRISICGRKLLSLHLGKEETLPCGTIPPLVEEQTNLHHGALPPLGEEQTSCPVAPSLRWQEIDFLTGVFSFVGIISSLYGWEEIYIYIYIIANGKIISLEGVLSGGNRLPYHKVNNGRK